MDLFNLDLNPAMSSGIFHHETFSNNGLNYLDNNDFSKINLEENLTDNFNKVFNSNTPDKEISISEDIDNNNLNINNVDEFIIHFQNEILDQIYFKKDFDGIIYQIEKQFPFFFNEKNTGLLYLIEKLRFFNLLKEKKLEEAKKLYQDKLIILIKEVKKQSWEAKNKFFIKLLKKPNVIEKQGDIQKRYYDQFSYELEKAIHSFLHEEDNNDTENKNDYIGNNNNNINYFASSLSIDFDNLPQFNNNKKYNNDKNYKLKQISKEKETEDGENEKVIIETGNNNKNEENDEFDFDNFSTKEEFSDFEDELQPKINADSDPQKNNSNINENNSNAIMINSFINIEKENENIDLDPVNNNYPYFSNFSDSSFSKSHKSSYEFENNGEGNELFIDTSTKNNKLLNKEPSLTNNYKCDNKIYDNNYNNKIGATNINIFNTISNNTKEKKPNKKGKNKNEETIFNQLPFLNSFKPKYIKRETIDKKIIRTFKNFVVKENKEKRLDINNANMDQIFFINLINGNLLPPIDFIDGVTGEIVKFNSFNCNYLLWFFSKKGVKDVYMNFINVKGKEFINNISQHYEISPEEKNQLNSYIINFPFIFDISLVNNITDGTEVTHLYRTVEKNKKLSRKKTIKNELDLKRKNSSSSLEKERNRSREFEDDDI